MFYTYILESKVKNRYYTGSCADLKKRFNQHNSGLVKSTKPYRPWIIVHKELFYDSKSARRRELRIKSWKKKSAIEKLIKTFQNFVEIEDPR